METTGAGVARSLRCPFCHESPGEPGITCGACHARHHAACWGETGRCASCGDARRLAAVLDPGFGARAARALGSALGAAVLAPLGWIGGVIVGRALARGGYLSDGGLFLGMAGHAAGLVLGATLGGLAGAGTAALGRRVARNVCARRRRPAAKDGVTLSPS